jgi:exopolyphosphatase/guanosine-5'-triphosphate,3'-diphosphate pyrophosphatase
VSGDVAVVIDIGGGSVEVTRGAGAAIELGRSFKLGVIRLTERFVRTDPLEARDERKLTRHIDAEIGKYLDQVKRAGFDRVIGTSGTILSLGVVASAAEAAEGAPLRSRRISAKALRRTRKELVALELEKRLRVPGLEPRRADLAVAGSILLDQILRRLGADEITLCDLSLREGLVLDYVARHRKEIAQADRYPDVRRRSVFELAERCHFWPEHSQQVARLAVGLFDHTRAIHGLTDREREWLEYAAILHDLGVHISYEGHHKHSYYLIKNGDLRGFEPDEIETIALVARYHRQATPKRRHDGFGDLRRPRGTVRTLARVRRSGHRRSRWDGMRWGCGRGDSARQGAGIDSGCDAAARRVRFGTETRIGGRSLPAPPCPVDQLDTTARSPGAASRIDRSGPHNWACWRMARRRPACSSRNGTRP